MLQHVRLVCTVTTWNSIMAQTESATQPSGAAYICTLHDAVMRGEDFAQNRQWRLLMPRAICCKKMNE